MSQERYKGLRDVRSRRSITTSPYARITNQHDSTASMTELSPDMSERASPPKDSRTTPTALDRTDPPAASASTLHDKSPSTHKSSAVAMLSPKRSSDFIPAGDDTDSYSQVTEQTISSTERPRSHVNRSLFSPSSSIRDHLPTEHDSSDYSQGLSLHLHVGDSSHTSPSSAFTPVTSGSAFSPGIPGSAFITVTHGSAFSPVKPGSAHSHIPPGSVLPSVLPGSAFSPVKPSKASSHTRRLKPGSAFSLVIPTSAFSPVSHSNTFTPEILSSVVSPVQSNSDAYPATAGTLSDLEMPQSHSSSLMADSGIIGSSGGAVPPCGDRRVRRCSDTLLSQSRRLISGRSASLSHCTGDAEHTSAGLNGLLSPDCAAYSASSRVISEPSSFTSIADDSENFVAVSGGTDPPEMLRCNSDPALTVVVSSTDFRDLGTDISSRSSSSFLATSTEDLSQASAVSSDDEQDSDICNKRSSTPVQAVTSVGLQRRSASPVSQDALLLDCGLAPFIQSPRQSHVSLLTLPNPAQSVSPSCQSFKSFTSSLGGPCCRICHDGEAAEQLISPCLCSGSLATVHKSCLERWLTLSASTKCELCLFSFTIDTKPIPFWKYVIRYDSRYVRRALQVDLLSFVIFTPLTAFSLYLCILGTLAFSGLNGASQQQVLSLVGISPDDIGEEEEHEARPRSTRWEAIGLGILSVVLFFFYVSWATIVTRYHVRMWRRWRVVHQRRILIHHGTKPSRPRQTPARRLYLPSQAAHTPSTVAPQHYQRVATTPSPLEELSGYQGSSDTASPDVTYTEVSPTHRIRYYTIHCATPRYPTIYHPIIRATTHCQPVVWSPTIYQSTSQCFAGCQSPTDGQPTPQPPTTNQITGQSPKVNRVSPRSPSVYHPASKSPTIDKCSPRSPMVYQPCPRSPSLDQQ